MPVNASFVSWALSTNAVDMLKILAHAGALKSLGDQCLTEVLETSVEAWKTSAIQVCCGRLLGKCVLNLVDCHEIQHQTHSPTPIVSKPNPILHSISYLPLPFEMHILIRPDQIQVSMALGINQMLQSMSYFIAGPVQKHRQGGAS